MAGTDGRDGRNGQNGKNGIDGNTNNGWLKESLDSLWGKYDEMNRTLIEVSTTLKLMPTLPTRPCREFIAHIEDHKELKRTLSDKFFGMVFDLGRLGLVVLITYYFTHK